MILRKLRKRRPRSGLTAATLRSLSNGAAAAGLFPCRRRPKWSAQPSPTSEESVKAVLAGIRRTVGAAPVRKKAATSDIVIAMASDTTSLSALRNRAVLLLGFAGAFRRSELVALN